MSEFARHVHLDFHTTELLAVGERFDGEQFAKTLKDAAVNSIVVFAKCHHGWCYYPTKIGQMHPQLKFDLLGEQIKACRRAGIRVIAYITGGWSESDAKRHPEWQAIHPEKHTPIFTGGGALGSYVPGDADSPKPNCTWAYLCMTGAYGEHIKALAHEVLDNYDVDGLFFDIMGLSIPCSCETCAKEMEAEGYDPNKFSESLAFTTERRKRFLGELRKIVDAKGRGLTVFFNSGGASLTKPEYWPYSTHFEMENLPTRSAMGYDAIVNRSKFFRELGKPVYGMTGKFHTDWGEFGGFKHPDALVQECAAMTAYGVRCNIGDQLHPNGEMNEDTYRLIGRAFHYVESIEDYIEGGVTASRLGLMFPTSGAAREGYAKLLSDSHMDFRVVADNTDLSELECIIVPAPIRLSETRERELIEFWKAGGKLILFGKPDGADQLLKELGYTDLGKAEFDKDYIRSLMNEDLQSPMLMYDSAYRFSMKGETLAELYDPYFARTEAHFCSHRNTPNKETSSGAAIVLGERALCFAHDFGTQYYEFGAYWCRKIFEEAVTRFYAREVEIKGLPVYGRYTMYRHGDELWLHLLSILPIQRRGSAVLEEATPVRDIEVTIPHFRAVSVTSKPQNEAMDFSVADGATTFRVRELCAHQLIVLKKE